MAFESGVVIFFRTLDQTNNLARSVHPDGRSVELRSQFSYPDDYIILDEAQNLLGVYPRDWVACILPLQTVGPADALNQQARSDNSTQTEARNPKGKLRRIEGIDPRA